VLLPVIDVDVSDATDQELELTLVEDVDQIGRNELIKAGNESVELLLDSGLDFPLRN
jgi:hypothetical protein